jgi:hypothetical protein
LLLAVGETEPDTNLSLITLGSSEHQAVDWQPHMASHPDYYALAQSIVAQLLDRGEFDWSREIEDAIEAGSTATEILMSVRLVLQRLLLPGEASDSEAVAADSLIVQLDGVLT